MTVISGRNFGPTPDCHFRCNCNNSDTCNSLTGQCPGSSGCERGLLPDGFDWKGYGCLTGKYTYTFKPVSQVRNVGGNTRFVCLCVRIITNAAGSGGGGGSGGVGGAQW